jgi:hypothetical protein
MMGPVEQAGPASLFIVRKRNIDILIYRYRPIYGPIYRYMDKLVYMGNIGDTGPTCLAGLEPFKEGISLKQLFLTERNLLWKVYQKKCFNRP